MSHRVPVRRGDATSGPSAPKWSRARRHWWLSTSRAGPVFPESALPWYPASPHQADDGMWPWTRLRNGRVRCDLFTVSARAAVEPPSIDGVLVHGRDPPRQLRCVIMVGRPIDSPHIAEGGVAGIGPTISSRYELSAPPRACIHAPISPNARGLPDAAQAHDSARPMASSPARSTAIPRQTDLFGLDSDPLRWAVPTCATLTA